VLFRVISWIVVFAYRKEMIHEITRNNTKYTHAAESLGYLLVVNQAEMLGVERTKQDT
jgi:hypothetical protein